MFKTLIPSIVILSIAFCIYNSVTPQYNFTSFLNKDSKDRSGKNPDRPDEFASYLAQISVPEGQVNNGYSRNYRIDELKKAKSRLYNTRLNFLRPDAITLQSRGPVNVPGRTRGLLIDPRDPQLRTWFVGTVGGGIWKTTDGGQSWVDKTQGLPNLAVTTLASSNADPDIIYAGTGEGYLPIDWIDGDGIFKSTDAGETWTQLSTTADNVEFQNINRIIVDPADPDILVVASQGSPPFTSGIYRSMDGGNNWEKTYDASTRIQQVISNPLNFNTQFATARWEIPQIFGGVLKSTDGGKSWKESSFGLFPKGRIEIAISAMDTTRLYAVAEGDMTNSSVSSTFSDLYISDDAGETWQIVKEFNNGDNVNWFRDQGWYNNTLAVHPFDSDILYVGGIGIFKITIQPGSTQEDPQIFGVTVQNTQSFLSFVPWGGQFLGGGFDTGTVWWTTGNWPGFPINVTEDDMTSIEIRFGPGLKQKAHRFVVPPDAGELMDGGAGVDPILHTYEDYVDVPFQVWDINADPQKQLMVSFRDQQRDSTFNLNKRDDNVDPQLLTIREYIFINAIDYDSLSPDSNITVAGGMAYKNIYALWPVLSDSGTWDPQNLPNSKIFASYGATTVRLKSSSEIADNGGALNFTNVHPDHHNILPIVTSSSEFRLLSANDGGIYVTMAETDPANTDSDWTNSGIGIVSGQFYGVDKKKASNEYIGGLQDNGTWRSLPNPNAQSAFINSFGGDGIEVAWNYREPDQVVITNPGNVIRKSTDGGNNFTTLSGITDQNSAAPFITRVSYNKIDPDVLFAVGASGVWRSNTFGNTWIQQRILTGWTGSDNITNSLNVESSLSNRFIIWAGGGMDSERKIHVSTNGGINYTQTNNWQIDTLGNISGLATHPSEENTAFVLFSFAKKPKVLRTKDLGQTWEDISGFDGNEFSSNGFPDVKVYCLFVFPGETNRIWVGTEIGIFESIDAGQSWQIVQGGFPPVSTWEIKAVDDQVVVATHGRGIWTATVDGMQWPPETITSIEEDHDKTVNIYPNPASNVVRISFHMNTTKEVILKVNDISGQFVRKLNWRANTGRNIKEIELSSFPNGIYIFSLELPEGQVAKKLIIRK